MRKNLSTNKKKLLVISDTKIFYKKDVKKGFGPVVKELKALLNIYDEITWFGFNDLSDSTNKSLIDFSDIDRINIVPFKPVGGNSLLSKIKILFYYPSMLNKIFGLMKSHEYIHTRAPSNPAFIAVLCSFLLSNKQIWHKYAGTWIESAPKFYRLQRFFLKRLSFNSKITINGNFSNKRNIVPFENPCLDSKDRLLGAEIVKTKKANNKLDFCFVGGINYNKGIEDLLTSFSKLNSERIGVLHVVGDGEIRKRLQKNFFKIKNKVVFYGFLAKDDIREIYKQCNFVVLPSRSEGFPKVISEAMNYGCIPIVSDISCISDYVKNNNNGYLITPPINEMVISKSILESLSITTLEFEKIINYNYNSANKFTYEYYVQRLKTEIFKDV